MELEDINFSIMKIDFLKSSASRFGAWSMCVAVALLTAVSFTSCSSDDDNGGGSSAGDQDGLVSGDLPSQGWLGSELNGIVTYKPTYDQPSYFAFSFKYGVCDNAVYNIVCESESEARYLSKIFKNGTWVSEDDDSGDDLEDPVYPDESYAQLPEYTTSLSCQKIVDVAKKFARTTRGVDNFVLKYDVEYNKNVIYVKINNLRGKTAAQIKVATNFWANGFGYEVPTSFLFGTWDEATGKYKCTDVYGIGATYEVDVDFSNGYVSKFVTTLTLPSESWATAFEMNFEESLDEYMEMFGKVPTISRNGNKVSVEAIVIEQVSHDDIMKYLYILDYMNNVPLLFSSIY